MNAESGAAPKASTEVPTLGKATVVAPALPWWALTGEILGKATMRYFGSYFFKITLLQSDTDGPPAYVKETKDSKANQKHGDDGRALKKGDRRIGELEGQLKEAKSKKEKDIINRKIRNIKRDGQRKKEGEEHSRGVKR